MNVSLDKTLCEKYPKMFQNRNKPMDKTAMCWGFQCGDGWFHIIDFLCEAMTNVYTTSVAIDEEDAVKLNLEKESYGVGYYFEINPPTPIVDSVKEKFGSLRFYYHLEFDPKLIELNISGKYPEIEKIISRYNDYFDGMVHMAETMSAHTCEQTGLDGEMHVSNGGKNGWYKTLNREYAKTAEFYVSRNYVPVADLPKEEPFKEDYL